jgi:hypothetical protein
MPSRRLAELRDNPRKRVADFALHATEPACGNVIGQHDPRATSERGDRSKRQFDGIEAEIHRYPDPGEERGLRLVEAGTAERGFQGLSFEVDRYENQRRRNLDLQLVEPAAFPVLALGLIHLEYADACHEFAAPVRKRVEACSENYVLSDSGSERLLNRILHEASSQRCPAAEAEQLHVRELRAQTVGDGRPRLARKRQREVVPEDVWAGTVDMKSAPDGGHDRGSAGMTHRHTPRISEYAHHERASSGEV